MPSNKSAFVRLLLACTLFFTSISRPYCTCEHQVLGSAGISNPLHQDFDHSLCCHSMCDCSASAEQDGVVPVDQPDRQPCCPVCSVRSSLFIRTFSQQSRGDELKQFYDLERPVVLLVTCVPGDLVLHCQPTSSASTRTRLLLRI